MFQDRYLVEGISSEIDPFDQWLDGVLGEIQRRLTAELDAELADVCMRCGMDRIMAAAPYIYIEHLRAGGEHGRIQEKDRY
jgi:hypothetical protein